MNKAPVLSERLRQRQKWLLVHYGEYDDNEELINESVGQLMRDFEQAKQETAREIFEDIWNKSVDMSIMNSSYQGLAIDPKSWQSLKDRYLDKYCVDCNGEVAVKLEDCPKFKEEK